MYLPFPLLTTLAKFIQDECFTKGLLSSPDEIAIACKQIAAEWCVALDGTPEAKGLDCDSIVGFAGRYGRHVSILYKPEKED
jgi:hypothetical protein